MNNIDLRCCGVDELLQDLAAQNTVFPFIHTDPPWNFRTRSSKGAAKVAYTCLDDKAIAVHLQKVADLAAPDCYLAVWCTFPKLWEWARMDTFMQGAQWQYVSGAAWGKTNGLGVGYHFRGDAELLLLYKRGNPLPKDGSKSNLWLTEETGGLWLAERSRHSEKPQAALEDLIIMATDESDTVLDLYAGESGSLARACQRLRRNYIGCEIDPIRHARAMARISQTEMAVS